MRARDVADPALLEGLDIDVGAYRFAFEQHLPADLIRTALKLPTQSGAEQQTQGTGRPCIKFSIA